MRVLHVLNGPSGGATIGALELMRASRRAGSGIEHFAVYPGLGKDPEPAVSSVCRTCREVPMRWWNSKTTLGLIRRLLIWGRDMQVTGCNQRTRQALRMLIREWKIDLIHSNTAAIIDGAIVAAQLGIPHVWHIRERIGRHGFMRFRLDDRNLARRIGRLSHTVIPMSRFVGEIFLEHGQATKTRVVYDGVDRDLYDSDDARRRALHLRHLWGVPEGAVLIGKVAGVISLIKRHDIFIRAAGILGRQNPAMRFAIIGPLPKLTTWARRQGMDHFEKLRRLVREQGVEHQFLWIDAVTDVGAMMNAIDILAHACDLEGFGRVAIEAMAAGKPVVGPAAGGFMESVIDGETGRLVQPGSPDALAQAIDEMASDAALRERYGRAGRERVAHLFSLERHLSAMREIYETALNRDSRELKIGLY